MRMRWLLFCCILLGATQAPADSYRDKDDSFNPMNMVQGMPNPMNMFDSSDRRWNDRHRRPPPPRLAPGYPYPRSPAYGIPPRPIGPYYSAPLGQTPRQTPPQPVDQDVTSPSPEPTTPTPVDTPAAPPLHAIPRIPQDRPDTAQPAYQFRPMTPVEPVPPAPLEANQQGSTSQSQQPSPERAVELPAAGQTIITPPYSEHETPMINGQPAKFRPMNLNVNTPTQ